MIGYLAFLIPALLGAQCILTVVLTKGEICPGQRGRVHKMLPVLLVGWLLAAISQVWAILPLLSLLFFTVKVKTSKTRDSGPLVVLYGSNLLGFISWIMLLPMMDIPEVLLSLVAVALYGSLLAHVLLTFSRTRLQAFHRILPFVGFISAIVSVLLLVWKIIFMGEAATAPYTVEVVISLLCLVAALLVWSGHILLHKTVNKWQLLVAAGLLTFSAVMQLTLF
ncbi:hypothetical protein [Photobacterium phosphoreum]|uniref:hypothetical protein n=1 Tax=Photobacterium phosphoreum TaxID=659 RepID=UPI001E44E44F|nr:hypothetical protein [Photobacterium phosphoreum]MCD9462914.1 hypothetical protein [Photobacterium phosphoreum]MCD9509889.1 hypothetical protein [Photobacterium phosphoreum]